MKTIAIIGGGITGVTTAYALAKRGFAVTLFERHRYAAMETSFANGGHAVFDRVALTVPANIAARACPQLSADEKAKLQAIEYQGIVCASVLLKKPLGPYYVTNITDNFVPFTAVIEMSVLVDRAEFGGHSLVYLPKYVAPDDAIFAESDESLRERFTAALAQMYPHFTASDVQFSGASFAH